MKVFKFGGASVKNAEGVRNLYNIVRSQNEKLVIVVSAIFMYPYNSFRIFKSRSHNVDFVTKMVMLSLVRKNSLSHLRFGLNNVS